MSQEIKKYPEFNDYYSGIAYAVSKRGNCIGSQVGAVIVLENRIVTTGYNGTPEKIKNCAELGCYRCANKDQFDPGRGYDICICVHAEQNALLTAARYGISVENGSVYSTKQPCLGCAKEMLQAKIKKVFYVEPSTIAQEAKADYERLAAGFESFQQLSYAQEKAA